MKHYHEMLGTLHALAAHYKFALHNKVTTRMHLFDALNYISNTESNYVIWHSNMCAMPDLSGYLL